MVRPSSFGFNEETYGSNKFQRKPRLSCNEVKTRALREFDSAVDTLRENGVNVHVFEDSPSPPKPDALFPNNWISIHSEKDYILYPMQAKNRRTERSPAIITALKNKFGLQCKLDLTHHEEEDKFLEGTGSIVFDHISKTAYAALSPRTDLCLLEKLCDHIDYRPFSFQALDQNRNEVYHTNVLMAIGTGYAVLCMDAVPNRYDSKHLEISLTDNSLEIIKISMAQMKKFAGNMIELENDKEEKLLIMSSTAYASLDDKQLNNISKYATPVPVPIPTIEHIGGGSIRCMIAEVFA